MSVLDRKKYIIIQMIEKATGDYHYPVTLYEAILDSAGETLDQILMRKIAELGLGLEDDLTEVVDELVEGEIKEIRDVVELINNKLSVRESQIAYLATNWLTGVLPLDLTEISKISPRTVHILEEEPTEGFSLGDYWESSIDRTQIKEYMIDGWVTVSENTGIMIYGMTSSYATDRKKFVITSSNSEPTDPGIDMNSIGDIHLYIGEDIIPYIWLGTAWSRLSQKPSTSTSPSKTSIDALIDLISCRYFNVAYSKTNPGTDYWYNGSTVTSNYSVTEGLVDFLKSLFPPNVEDYASIRRKIFICPKKPTLSTEGDAWIDTRSYRIYLNRSSTVEPMWVQQSSKDSVISTLACTNLFEHSDRYDPFTDRQVWLDIRTNTYSTMEPTSTVDGLGVHEITTANTSLTQKVSLRPNTMYTYSLYVKASDSSRLPNMYFYADGCEIVSTSLVNGSLLEYSDSYVRHFVTFITGPKVTESLCRLESPSGNPYRIYGLCLQEGDSTEWTPSIKDLLSDFDSVLNTKSQTVIVSRETDTPERSTDCDLWVTSSGSVIKMNKRGTWVTVDGTVELAAAVESLYEIYTSQGYTTITTSHSNPTNPSVGDYWIKDDLSAVRYTGTGWGSISGVLASEQRVLSGKVYKNTDTLLQSVFLESTINVDDLFDLAQSIDPTIRLYKQGTQPTDAKTGDVWQNTDTGGVFRFNGVSWVPDGAAKVSSVEQDINGVRTEVSEIYDGGGGRNLLRDSASVEPSSSPYVVYTELGHGQSYVFSVQASESTGVSQYKVRVTNATHSYDYNNTTFQVGRTIQLWRFDTHGIPSGVSPHLIITWDTGTLTLLQKIQLENGKVYTDWKPAPEDTTQQIDNLNSTVNTLGEDVSGQTAKLDTISQDLANAIRISNEALSRSVVVEQTAGSLSVTSSALVRRVTETEDVLSTYSSVFDFLPQGLQISSAVDGIKSDISTIYRYNGMYFWSASAGSDVGYVTSEGLSIRNARVQVGGILAMGNYQWKPRSSGATSLIYEPV